MSLPTTSSFPIEQLQVMGQQLQSLTRRVEQLEAQADPSPASPLDDPQLQAAVAKAAEFAAEIFQSPVQIEQDYDPESPDSQWYTICVIANAGMEQRMNLRHQWYERKATLQLDDPTTIRLFMAFPE